jgi:ankyrin repeat protein
MKRGPSLVNVATDDGGTPAMSAACHGRSDALLALVEMGATLDTQDVDGWTALMYAAVEVRPLVSPVVCCDAINSTYAPDSGTDSVTRAGFSSPQLTIKLCGCRATRCSSRACSRRGRTRS